MTKPYTFDTVFPNWLQFDRWDDYFNSGIEDRPLNKYRWNETEDSYSIDIVMPGLTKKDIDLSFKNETLTIKCSKEVSEKDKNFLGVKTEQSFRNFPAGIDSTNISAEMVDGILKVTLPKREADKPKSIEIK